MCCLQSRIAYLGEATHMQHDETWTHETMAIPATLSDRQLLTNMSHVMGSLLIMSHVTRHGAWSHIVIFMTP
jgi:hypothetical protein